MTIGLVDCLVGCSLGHRLLLRLGAPRCLIWKLAKCLQRLKRYGWASFLLTANCWPCAAWMAPSKYGTCPIRKAPGRSYFGPYSDYSHRQSSGYGCGELDGLKIALS